jgi:integrase
MADKRTPVRGQSRIYKTGAGTYEAHVEPKRIGGQRQKPLIETFPTLREAIAWQTQTKEDVRGGTYVDRKTSPTVGEQMRVWQARQTHHRPGTVVNVDQTIRLHIEPYPLAVIRLVDLTRRDIQAWVDDLSGRLSPASVHGCAAWLKAMLNDAADAEPPQRPLIPSSPMRRVKLPPIVPTIVRADRVLTTDQVLRLADAMTHPSQATMVRVQAGTGMRVGELIGLRVRDVDFLRREIHLDSQIGQWTMTRVPLKTKLSRRVIPLPQWVAYELSEHIRRYPPLADQDGLIFYNKAGNSAWTSYPKPLTLAARKLHAADPSFPEVSTHDLRHHYVSLLIYQGHSAVAIGARIGDTPQRVWDTYAHVWPGSDDDTRQAIDEAYGVTGPRSAVAFRLPSAEQHGG